MTWEKGLALWASCKGAETLRGHSSHSKNSSLEYSVGYAFTVSSGHFLQVSKTRFSWSANLQWTSKKFYFLQNNKSVAMDLRLGRKTVLSFTGNLLRIWQQKGGINCILLTTEIV